MNCHNLSGGIDQHNLFLKLELVTVKALYKFLVMVGFTNLNFLNHHRLCGGWPT